jgi:dCTP deaminase
MTILSTKIILQRLLEGTPKDCLNKIRDDLSPKNPTITNEQLAEAILKDEEKSRKFSEIFKIEVGEIRRFVIDYVKDYDKLSLEDKKEKSKKNEFPILFDSLDIEKIRPTNIDLRLGDQYFVSREKFPKRLVETGGYVAIEPGDFAVLTTHEYMYVPNDLLGLISLRYKYKKSGLINISGFHVDPGYTGRLMFSVYNSGPKSIVLKHKEPIFMIMFDKLEEPVLKGYGKGLENITTDDVSELIGYSISPIHLKEKIDHIETHLRIVEGIVIALFVAVVIALIKFIIPAR